jgi:heptosyltransferase II
MPGFLLIQTASIGDVILITSAVEKLHRHFQAEPIDLLVKKGMESLFLDHPFLRTIYTWDKSGHKYANLYKLWKQVRKNRYSRVINFQRFASTGLLTVLSGAEFTAGFSKNPFSSFFTVHSPHSIEKKGTIHETERNHQLIAPYTDAEVCMPRLYPSATDHLKVKKYKNAEYICIAPASLWFTKQFPVSKWIDFINKLPADLIVYLLGSKKDEMLCDEIIKSSIQNNIMNLAGKLNLLESAALMSGARMNYVNDSAPLHIASAVNAPVTAVFCSTVVGFGFAPLSRESYIVETQESLTCRPCGLHGYDKCPLNHFKCALTISSEQLLNCLPDERAGI